MTAEQIHKLATKGIFQEPSGSCQLAETHISWVILCDRYVYKIKKPVKYSFLDFSSLENRHYFCQREITLNKRLTENIYLDVLPVTLYQGNPSIGSHNGETIDYAVYMYRMDTEKQMDRLLEHDRVSKVDIQRLAKKIAGFHARTGIIYDTGSIELQHLFNELGAENDHLNLHHSPDCGSIISAAVEWSDNFLALHAPRLAERLQDGFIRDGHSDLHSRNIFLLPSPQPFDCIEFNDKFREIDVLNEIAFLCMDLDSVGREDLSQQLLEEYNRSFPSILKPEDREIFIYFKCYRANVRAKVNSLRSKSATAGSEKEKHINNAYKYLKLMESYMNLIK